jgi:predicted ATPase
VANPSGFIKTVRLSNILSFGSEGAEIDLQPLNILIGPNTSGKSNFLEVLALLRSLRRDSELHLDSAGGFWEWAWKGGVSKQLPALEVVVATSGPTLRYSLSFSSSWMGTAIEDEVVQEIGPASASQTNRFYYKHVDGTAIIYQSGLSQFGDAGVPRDVGRPKLDPGRSIFSQVKDSLVYPELTELGHFFGSIYLMREVQIGAFAGARLPQRSDMPSDFLLEDARNLGLVINDLQSKPATWRLIVERLRDVYPDFEDIHAKIIPGGFVQLLVSQKGLRDPISVQRLSDGTLRYLCLLCILCHPEPPPVICIEEPELGLHPDLIHKVAELLREASERTQLIVTTHSDILVSAFEDRPEAIVVCERDEDGTHLRRLESERLREWLKEYSLGDLWISGEIGGTRW